MYVAVKSRYYQQKSATPHFRILPVTSTDFIRKNHPHFTRFNICRSARLHFTIGRSKRRHRNKFQHSVIYI